MTDELLGNYGGVEPVDVGNLDDVREQRIVIPASKGVVVRIKKAENMINKDNTYRQINLQLQLVDGLAEGKFKGKVVFTRVCYYADPNAYTKDYFKNKQHLVQLKYLLRAVGATSNVVDGHLIDNLMSATPILCDITVNKKVQKVDDGTGNIVDVETLENECRNFKAYQVSV